MHTTLGTWSRLFGSRIDDIDLDPFDELGLTTKQRRDMNRAARDAYMDFAENLLQEAFPEAGIMVDRLDGDVLVDVDAGIDPESPEWDDLAYEVNAGPDLDDLIAEYAALADEDAEEEEEEGEDEVEPIGAITPGMHRYYAGLIGDEAYTYLASLHPETALHKSGEVSDRLDSQDVRLGFIAATSSALFLRALQDMKAAEDEKTERKALAAVFLEAHAQAAHDYAATQEAIRTGQVMTGTVFRGLAHGLGCSDEALAEELGVRDVRTIRHWKAGKRPIPTGVGQEMWAMWDRFLDEAYARIGDGEARFALVGDDVPAAAVAAVAILHGRVAQEPSRPRHPWIE